MNFRYSANIGFLWDDLPLPDRIVAAKNAGFDAVECHFPYDHPAVEIRNVLEQTGLSMVGLNTALGDNGNFGMAAIAGAESSARELIDQAIDYAVTIGAQNINVVAGLTQGSHADKHPNAETVYKQNLSYACSKALEFGKTIVIEPLNPRAVPDYHFSSVEQGIDIIESVGSENLKLMFDFFHAQIVQGDIETLIRQYIDHIGHIQISAVHDRGEPDQGELNYPYLLNVLSEAGYTGHIGAEYRPRGPNIESGLGWLEQFRRINTT